jgi:hypothetical protein
MDYPVSFRVYKGVKLYLNYAELHLACSMRMIRPMSRPHREEAICLLKTSAGAPVIPGGSYFPSVIFQLPLLHIL